MLDLLELEGALLRRKLLCLAVSLALVALAALLAGVGLCLLAYALYLYAAQALGAPAAAFIAGLSLLTASGILAWTAKRKNA